MAEWTEIFKFDPLSPLERVSNLAVRLNTRKFLLDEETDPSGDLWTSKEVERIFRRQHESGFWKYPAGNLVVRTQENYNQLETYRQLGFLVEKYMLNKKHTSIQKACDFLLSFQTTEGDIRGIYGNQYTPNYTAGILELLIKAGYTNDPRVLKGLEWLLSIRQNDGGWAIPIRTRRLKLDSITPQYKMEAVLPDRKKPFSHLVTGVVLRALAVHPKYSKIEETLKAGELLIDRFFKADTYSDRKSPDFWCKFAFPFWFTDLLSALDSLASLNHTLEKEKINEAVQYFITTQSDSGLWTSLKLLKIKGTIAHQWISMVITRTIKRLVLNANP
ncbi:MAG: hypothetical protein ACFFE8_05005 [Candidatus Heimdallarchaeota archaeon]